MGSYIACASAVRPLTFALPPPSGLAYNPPEFKEKDVSCIPTFTQPLLDRSVVAGYSTAMSCSVKGFPKVPDTTGRNRFIIPD